VCSSGGGGDKSIDFAVCDFRGPKVDLANDLGLPSFSILLCHSCVLSPRVFVRVPVDYTNRALGIVQSALSFVAAHGAEKNNIKYIYVYTLHMYTPRGGKGSPKSAQRKPKEHKKTKKHIYIYIYIYI
jgi:hypothetical protein